MGEVISLQLIDSANLVKEEARQRHLQAVREQEEEHATTLEKGKYLFANRPTWAKAAILAEHNVDQSDVMSDYHGHTTDKTVFLAWSRHTQDRFDEMRKAAALFPETAHLGPSKDVYTARVILNTDIPNSNGCAYWKGNPSHWHSELDGEPWGGGKKKFTTKAEAEAFVASAPQPESISFDGLLAEFSWEITCKSVEHREKYSMGAGYYLKDGHRDDTGWQVSKRTISDRYGNDEICLALANTPKRRAEEETAVASQSNGAITVTENQEKNGIEIRFPDKPSEQVREQLKSHGFRWSKFQGMWYARRNPETLTFAQSLLS